MRKFIALLLLLLMATPAWLWAQGWPSYTMPLVAKDGVFVSADHSGALFVTQRPAAYGGAAWLVQIEHAQSVLHIAGLIRGFGPQGTNVVDLSNAALQVNCVVGCGSGGTQAHITSVTHIIGSAQLISQAGVVATFTGASLNVNCTGGCAGGSSDAVNVFHQSTIRHISSVTHVSGSLYLTDRAGVAVTVTGTALDVNCTGCSAASVTAISHISAMAHTSSVVVGFGKQNTDVVDVANASLKVVQGPARWPISHVTSVTHVTLGRSPQFTMMVANCGTGASTVLQANPSRRKLILQNSGQAHIAVGGGHVTVTIANGFLLMSATTFPAPATNVITGWNNSRLELDDYQGPIQCIGQGANQRLDIIQVIQ